MTLCFILNLIQSNMKAVELLVDAERRREELNEEVRVLEKQVNNFTVLK